MAYNCDICSKEMSAKSNGTFFDQNRVLTSPGYWEHVCQKGILPIEEEMLGMFLANFCRDTSGFTVCGRCKNMLGHDLQKAKKYELEKYVSSVSSEPINSHAAAMVAGTVWKNSKGHWPSTIRIGGTDDPQGTLIEMEDTEKSDCFVATVAFDDPQTPEVVFLRYFRDRHLLNTTSGKFFIAMYYRFGPYLAMFVGRSLRLKTFSRNIISNIIIPILMRRVISNDDVRLG